MNQFWRRGSFLWRGILALSVLLIMTGCQKKTEDYDILPDSFWQQAQEEMEGKAEVFSNQDASYYVSLQEGGEEDVRVLVQQRPDGTLVQNHEVNQLENIVQVTDAYLYYVTWESEIGQTVFWRVPIQKTESGDLLVWEKKEVLLQDILHIAYITDAYVIYEMQDGIYKLDLQNGEKIPLKAEDQYLDGTVVRDRNRKTIFLNGRLFILSGTALYCLEPDQAISRQVYTGAKWKDESIFYQDSYMVSFDGGVCFSCDNETVWLYRDGEEQAECIATRDTFFEALQKAGLKKKKKYEDYCITEMIFHQERIYFLLKEGSDMLQGADEGDFCLFSVPISDPSSLQNESAVTEYWSAWETASVSADSISDDVVGQAVYVYKPVRIAGIVDHKIILQGRRLLYRAVSLIDNVYCAAYDMTSNQMLEREDIRKVIH